MTNLKSDSLNKKFYQSGITKIPIKEYNKNVPIIKIITEFRTPSLGNSRNLSFGDKYNSNYKFNNQTYTQVNTTRTKITVNKDMAKVNKKENEEKNKFSQINSNTINNKKNIVFLTTRVNVYTSKTYTNNKNSNYTTQKPKEENRKILVNTNARPNTNFYHQNQNKMNIQSNQPSRYNISNYNKEAKEGENILTKKELDKDNKNLQEVKDDQHNIQEEKPKYINKLPLTVNINLNTQKIDDKDSKIIPISKEKASTENVNNINKKIIEQGNYVNKMNNYNIQPSSNIKNPVAQTKVITTNTNINKPIITNRGITNRNGNKYQHSNLNNVITTSSRPVTTRNYQTNTPNNIKKVISSNRPTGIKTENIEKKILVEKYLKPETKSTNTLDTKIKFLEV